MRSCLFHASRSLHRKCTLVELDICRSSKHDLTLPSVLERWKARIQRGIFSVVLASPPCNTFSRATFSGKPGPRPVRDFNHPKGLPHLTTEEFHKVRLGNLLVEHTCLLLTAQLQAGGYILLEHPEDLGACPKGVPASIWQWPEVKALLKHPQVWSAAFHQSDFGTPWPKPTRILARLPPFQDPRFHVGLPSFSDTRTYMGPLPRSSSPSQLIGRTSSSTFATAQAAAWPIPFCRWLAQLLLTAPLPLAKGGESLVEAQGSAGSPTNERTTSTAQSTSPPRQPVPSPAPRATSQQEPGPAGAQRHLPQKHVALEPRRTRLVGRVRDFHDGGGLPSWGRLRPKDRPQPSPGGRAIGQALECLLLEDLGENGWERMAFKVACGRLEASPFPSALVERGRLALADLLRGVCPGEVLTAREPGQKFLLGLMKAAAKFIGDPDWEVLESYQKGVPLGVLRPLPRTPQIFEEQTRWRLPDFTGEDVLLEKANYKSVQEVWQDVEKQFEDEAREGRMIKLTDSEAAAKFGKNLAVGALAAIVEPSKVRIVHDGTHGIQVNNRIRCLDQLRMPGPAEVLEIIAEAQEDGEGPLLAVLGDFEKAHRQVKVDEAEWGFMACRTQPGYIWVNTCGTFGISSAAYWWSRLAALLVRLAHCVIPTKVFLEILLFADDYLLLSRKPEGRRATVLVLFLWTVLGAPTKWSKSRGGFCFEWIGLEVDLKAGALGLSEARAAWLVAKAKDLSSRPTVDVAEFATFLGRCGFAAAVLGHLRPLLGPFYAWSAGVQGRRWAELPAGGRFLLRWLAGQIGPGARLRPPEARVTLGEVFRADAKAEGDRAFVGGWLCQGGMPPGEAPWFALEVTREWAPWAFARGNPGRSIAALELLATLLSVKLLLKQEGGPSAGRFRLTGSTDNLGNSYVLSRLSTTRYPLVLLLLELSEELRCRDIELHLDWIPREKNEEADALTNGQYESFNPSLRVEVDGKDLKWRALHGLATDMEQLFGIIAAEKEDRRKRKESGHRVARAAKRTKRSDWGLPA